MTLLRALFGAALAAVATGVAAGQDSVVRRQPLGGCRADAPGKGTIAGRLVADSAGIRVERGVHIDQRCMTFADAAGNFVFRGLPPGDYMIGVGDLAVQRVRPVKVIVEAERTTTIEIHLRPLNVVADCAAIPRCAPLLDPPRELRADVDSLREIAFRTAVIMAVRERDTMPLPVFCLVGVASDSAPLLAALRRRVESLRPQEHCERWNESSRTNVERSTGRLAWFLQAAVPIRSGDEASGEVSFHAGPLWGSGWRCNYRRSEAGWRLVGCTMTWVS